MLFAGMAERQVWFPPRLDKTAIVEGEGGLDTRMP